MSRSVLIIDDEDGVRKSLADVLGDEGYRVSVAASGREGLEKLRSEQPELLLLDIWMPEMDGLEVLQQIRAEGLSPMVVVMSGHGTIETAVKAVKLGAFDFIEKPLSLERLLVILQNAAGVHDLNQENLALRKQVQKHRNILGESGAIRQIRELIRKVAPTSASVLITGENGTGKEVVAHAIHALSPRFKKPFVEVNCAAIPEELIESELFGHEKGAFTGATQLRRGKFDLANGGTLFLDEIGDMSLKTQAKILRIIQEQKFERVGGPETISVDVRIIAATNKDLKAEIKRDAFREDLFYRLNVIPFHIPPLRERSDDVVFLSEHFLREYSTAHARAYRSLTPEALGALSAYSWPGNVRELKNLIERIIILTPDARNGSPITAAEILEQLNEDSDQTRMSHSAAASASATSLRDARNSFEKDFIIKTLKDNDWNVSKTAQVLGIERSHLHKKMKGFGIEGETR